MRKILLFVFLISYFLLQGCEDQTQMDYKFNGPTDYRSTLNLSGEPYSGPTKPVLRILAMIPDGKDKYMLNVGTGFIIEYNKKKYIVTASHVINNATCIEFYTYDGKYITVEISKIVNFIDLDSAMIEIKSISVKVDALIANKYDKGDIKVLGYPNHGDYTESSGSYVKSNICTNAFVDVGMSGGPALNSKGEVIGILSSRYFSGGTCISQFSRLEDVLYALDNLPTK